jgi:hypothetical protein
MFRVKILLATDRTSMIASTSCLSGNRPSPAAACRDIGGVGLEMEPWSGRQFAGGPGSAGNARQAGSGGDLAAAFVA